MSAKRLLPLVLILIVLGGAAVVLKRQPEPPRLTEETGFERLVPPALRAESIRGVDLYQGAKPQEAVRLRQQDGTWVVASYHNAPVQKDKISKFLQAISTLEGELRAEQAELLGDFRLEESQALHLRLYTDNLDTPALHLLAGKGSGRNGFVRLANQPRVYSVNLNVQSEAGVASNAPEASLQAKPWLNLQIQDVSKEQMTALELHTPERSLRFTQPPAAVPPTTGATPEAAAKASWELTAPPLPYAVKPGGLEGLVSTLRTLRAEDIADPAHLADYGLDTPAYRALMTVQAANQEARQVVLAVGQAVPEQSGKRYARLDPQGPIYILPSWNFTRIFPPAKDLLELPQLAEDAADIQRVAWQYGTESWTLEGDRAAPPPTGETQASTTWRLMEAPQVAVENQAVQSLFEAITRLAIEDWVEHPATPAGLDQPQLVLQVTTHNGRTTHLTVGGPRGTAEGQYVSLPEAPGTFVVSATTYKTLTEALSALRPPGAAAAAPATQAQ